MDVAVALDVPVPLDKAVALDVAVALEVGFAETVGVAETELENVKGVLQSRPENPSKQWHITAAALGEPFPARKQLPCPEQTPTILFAVGQQPTFVPSPPDKGEQGLPMVK